jgi:hypothetical protein
MLRYVMSSHVENDPQCANLPSQRQKSGGGGGRGRGQGQGGQHRDYDNPSYGQPSNNNSAPQNVQPGGAAPAAAGGGADPYAVCTYTLTSGSL